MENNLNIKNKQDFLVFVLEEKGIKEMILQIDEEI